MADNELCRLCETADAEAWWSMLQAADPGFRERYNIKAERIGGMVVGATGSFDVVALNRAVGVQIDHRTSAEEIRQIGSIFEECGSRRSAIQLCPSASTPEVLDLLRSEGFVHFNNWTKLVRKVNDPAPEADTHIRVERIGADMATVFAEIVCPAFGWPGLMKQWIARMVGTEGWYHYLAYEHDEPVATGAMFVLGQVAWFGYAATRPDFRRHGAQSSLICKRLDDARTAGCSHIVVETAEEQPEKPNPSYHNLIRYGFAPAYQRPNYLKVRSTHT